MKKLFTFLLLFVLLAVVGETFAQPRQYRAKRLVCDSIKIGATWVDADDVALLSGSVDDTVGYFQDQVNNINDTISYFQTEFNNLDDTVTYLQGMLDRVEAKTNFYSYVAHVSQRTTADPIEFVIFQNDFDTVLVWERLDSGVYRARFGEDSLTYSTAMVAVQSIYPYALENVDYALSRIEVNSENGAIYLYTYNSDGAASDDWIAIIEVRVYIDPYMVLN